MAVDPLTATILIVGSAAAGLSVAGGFAARDAAKAEASALETQAHLARSEAAAEAERKAIETRKFKARQALAYLKSGVSLIGSPLLLLEETRVEGLRESEAIRKRGAAQSNLYRAQASATRNKGRAALIGGVAQGASTLVSTGVGIHDAGLSLLKPKTVSVNTFGRSYAPHTGATYFTPS